MGFDLEYVSTADRLHKELLYCVVCEELASLESYVVTPCSHIICKECVGCSDRTIRRCPGCAARIEKGQIGDLQEAQPLASKILGMVTVSCPADNDNKCCQWTGTYAQLQAHLNKEHPTFVARRKKVKRQSQHQKNMRRNSVNNTNTTNNSNGIRQSKEKDHQQQQQKQRVNNKPDRGEASSEGFLMGGGFEEEPQKTSKFLVDMSQKFEGRKAYSMLRRKSTGNDSPTNSGVDTTTNTNCSSTVDVALTADVSERSDFAVYSSRTGDVVRTFPAIAATEKQQSRKDSQTTIPRRVSLVGKGDLGVSAKRKEKVAQQQQQYPARIDTTTPEGTNVEGCKQEKRRARRRSSMPSSFTFPAPSKPSDVAKSRGSELQNPRNKKDKDDSTLRDETKPRDLSSSRHAKEKIREKIALSSSNHKQEHVPKQRRSSTGKTSQDPDFHMIDAIIEKKRDELKKVSKQRRGSMTSSNNTNDNTSRQQQRRSSDDRGNDYTTNRSQSQQEQQRRNSNGKQQQVRRKSNDGCISLEKDGSIPVSILKDSLKRTSTDSLKRSTTITRKKSLERLDRMKQSNNHRPNNNNKPPSQSSTSNKPPSHSLSSNRTKINSDLTPEMAAILGGLVVRQKVNQ